MDADEGPAREEPPPIRGEVVGEEEGQGIWKVGKDWVRIRLKEDPRVEKDWMGENALARRPSTPAFAPSLDDEWS